LAPRDIAGTVGAFASAPHSDKCFHVVGRLAGGKHLDE
jgi:hypothetical protein